MAEKTDGMMTRRAALRRAAHVLGGAVSAATMAGVLAGCEAVGDEAAGGDTGGAARTSQVLSPDQDEIILTIGEYLIPSTDTPGARAARVHEYIDAMLADFYPAEERDRFLAGLERVDGYARRRFGERFVDLEPAQQVELAAALHAAAFPRRQGQQPPPSAPDVAPGEQGSPSVPGPTRDGWHPDDVGRNSFMGTLKELVVVGYYTSEIGATQELALNPMGVWLADIPYSEVGRAWA